MAETVYKPSLGDVIVGIVVSLVAAFTFSPLVGLVVLLVDGLIGLSMSAFVLLLIGGCLLSGLAMFILLWRNSVSKRDTE